MKKYLKILKKCPLFLGIADEELLRLLHCRGARVISFDKKYTVFAEGGPSQNIGILLSGSVQAVATDYLGNRSIIQSFSPCEMFCEEFAASGTPSLPVSFIASERSEVMLIGCESILHTCENACGFHHTLIYNLMKALAGKAVAFHERIEITSKRTTREKLLTYLAIRARASGKSSFEIPFNRQELADYLEVERSGLSVEIGKLIRCGMIDADRKTFTVYF